MKRYLIINKSNGGVIEVEYDTDNVKPYCVRCELFFIDESFEKSLKRYEQRGNYCERCCAALGYHA